MTLEMSFYELTVGFFSLYFRNKLNKWEIF